MKDLQTRKRLMIIIFCFGDEKGSFLVWKADIFFTEKYFDLEGV